MMAAKHPMSDGHRRNVIEALSTALRWGTRDSGGRLPADYRMPDIAAVLGRRPRKDPLRKVVWALERRLQLVHVADSFALTTFALQLLLPPRPEQIAGLLVSEVDWQEHALHFGTRFNGDDHTKGRTTWWLPFPPELELVLRAAIGGRAAGPVFRKRSVVEGSRSPDLVVERPKELEAAISVAITTARSKGPITDNDAKDISRRIIAEAGGITENDLGREFGQLAENAGCIDSLRYYDLRSAVLSEFRKVDIPKEVRAYLAGHEDGTGGSLDEYECFSVEDLHRELQPHWNFARRLIDAILERGRRLGTWK
jgi:hypothetical protein